LIILAIAFLSCQTAPQSPINQGTQERAAGTAPRPHEGFYSSSPGADNAPSEAAAPPDKFSQDKAGASKSVSIGASVPPPKKVPPIKAVTSPVETGLVSPANQQVPAGAPLAPSKEKQRIVLNFEKADVAEVTNQIFSDQLKINYVMDQALQGRISMYIEGDFDNDELLQMVTKAYEANGVSIIPKKGFYFIQASQKTGMSGLPVANESLLGLDKPSRPLIVIYRLRFIDTKQATNLITPFLTPGRKVIAESFTNTLVFVEETDNARSLVNLLKTIDINILKEISMEIVPIYTIAPQDAIQGMESLMNKLGGFKESAIKNSLAFMPLNNFGGVLVLAQNPELIKSAKQWIQALDVRGVGNQEDVYVYFTQNGLARDIAQIVGQVFGITTGTGGMGQQIVPSGRPQSRSGMGGTGFGGGTTLGGSSGFGGGSSTGGSSTGGGGLFGGGGTSTGAGTGTSGGAVSGSSYGGAASRTGTGAGGGAVGGGTGGAVVGTAKPGGVFSGEVMIIADEVNNAIVVRANAVDYGKIKKTIETLDILPRAVLIEVMVAEVELNKDFSFGLQYYFQTHPNTGAGYSLSFGGLSNAAATTTSSTASTGTVGGTIGNVISQSIGAAAPGIGAGWVANAQNIAVLLSALSTKTNINVLSTPTLLATDNKEATITVGGRQPVPTGSYSTAETGTLTNSVFSTIEYAETGVILNVTPHINAGGLVRIELEQTIRRVGASTTVGAGNTAPTFTERNLKTTLLAQSGSTVVIGGIIDSAQQSTKGGIPYLENIPLLSPLFSSKSSNLIRTELLIAITPHVIDQRGSEAPIELLQKLNNLKIRTGQ
jgi:general secretion pathway protein D